MLHEHKLPHCFQHIIYRNVLVVGHAAGRRYNDIRMGNLESMNEQAPETRDGNMDIGLVWI